jgi:hypothetical protein
MTMNPATNPTNATNPPATCTLVAPLVAEVEAAAALPDAERDADDAIGVAEFEEAAAARTDVVIDAEETEDEDEVLLIMVDEDDVVTAPVEFEVEDDMVEFPPMSIPVPHGMAAPPG